MKKLACILALILSGCATFFPHDPPQERWFKYVDYDRGRISYRLGIHRVLETDHQGNAVTGDTLLAYVDHYGPGMPVQGQMVVSDLLIVCFPELLPSFLIDKHVLPKSYGTIYVAEWFDTPLFVVFGEDLPAWIKELVDRGELELPETIIPEANTEPTSE